MEARHCIIEFMKHVLPRFLSPTFRKSVEVVLFDDDDCVVSIMSVSFDRCREDEDDRVRSSIFGIV